VLLYLGRIHPKKGLRDLLRAFDECRRHGPREAGDWVLVVAGWGEPGHIRCLREDIHSLELGNCARFVGELHGKAKTSAFAHAEAFVLPSYSEGLPMTALEASAHGLPAVLTEECHLSSLGEAEAAIEVPCGCPGVSRGLQRLLSTNEAERGAMGDKARAIVAREFAWERVAAEMRHVYDWILGGGDPPACVERGIE
jgi:poly(glycerol-phosphate) alpha-glucosyltransferase